MKRNTIIFYIALSALSMIAGMCSGLTNESHARAALAFYLSGANTIALLFWLCMLYYGYRCRK